jgi:peptidoglycan/LPS O-acetylase OafA/YrhL
MIQPSAPVPNPYASAPTPGGAKPIWSLCLGLFGLLAWLLPIIGLPTTITGLVLGIESVNGSRKGMATAGIVLCIIGLVLSTGNAALGAYLGATGQLHYFQ